MAIYVVMEPPAATAEEEVEKAVFIRDGFSILAFLVPPLWLLWHRLWLAAALAVAAGAGLAVLGETAGLGMVGSALSLLVSIFVGLEGPALRIDGLRRRGWHEWGVVEANNGDDAELRYLIGKEPHRVHEAASPAPVMAPAHQQPIPHPTQTGPALGLLGYPGRH